MADSNESQQTLATTLVECLLAAGVDTVFGVGGTHTLPLLGAIERAPDMNYVAARTELGATYMALGYARATNRPAIALTSTGPGALNATSALADAKWASLPLLHITSSIRDGEFAGATHETPYQYDLMLTVGKGCVRVDRKNVNVETARAVWEARIAPAGPVTIDLPAGGLGEPSYPSETRELSADASPRCIDPANLAELVAALEHASRPLLYVGGGAFRGDCGQAVLRLAERLQAPIITSYQGKAIANWTHPLYLGPWMSEATVRDLCAQADIAIVLGSKLSAFGTDQFRLPLPSCTYRIDAGGGKHPKYPHVKSFAGDIEMTVSELAEMIPQRSSWAANDVRDIQAAIPRMARERGPAEMTYLDALAAGSELPKMIVGDTTKAAFWALKFLGAAEGAIHSFSSYLAMGNALPMAIGMAVATSSPVLVIVGDGGLQMSLAEIATLGELQLPITLVVIVDNAYGMLRDNGVSVGGSKDLGVTLWNPDLRALCGAYDVEHSEIESAADFSSKLNLRATKPRMLIVRQRFGRNW
jgi:acetolactate synthase-1/2/3 large subunit